MKLNAFIAANKLSMTSYEVDENPNLSDSNWIAYHYKCKIKLNGVRKQMSVYFSQGTAIEREPSLVDVLDCLASDAAGFENARHFEDWAGEYGYDIDSIKARKVYKLIGNQSKKLKDFLGPQRYNQLLWEVER